MVEKPIVIRFDSQAQAWTDGTNYVAGKIIRRYARITLGRKDNRGRLSREEISRYFKEAYGVIADVE